MSRSRSNLALFAATVVLIVGCAVLAVLASRALVPDRAPAPIVSGGHSSSLIVYLNR